LVENPSFWELEDIQFVEVHASPERQCRTHGSLLRRRGSADELTPDVILL
jgi:hypothetical protein